MMDPEKTPGQDTQQNNKDKQVQVHSPSHGIFQLLIMLVSFQQKKTETHIV